MKKSGKTTPRSDLTERQYHIDWLRVIAISILLPFHAMVMYQTYAPAIRFIQSPTLLDELLIPLSLSSAMRIPLLFFVAGMGAFFSSQSRTWLQLIGERSLRILVPLVFGIFVIVPIHEAVYDHFYGESVGYHPGAAHLWFLINIYMYVLWFLALFYFAKQIPATRFVRFLRSLVERSPFAIYLIGLPYILEALTIPAELPYSLYFDARVGLLLGGVAFLTGFLLTAIGDTAFRATAQIKYYALGTAVVLYLVRILVLEGHGPHIVTALESFSWIMAAIGLAYVYLNKPSRALSYLTPAAYPVYILHMIFLYLGAWLIFPTGINPWLSLIAITLISFAGSYATYEILRRIFLLRPLFGLKLQKK